LIYEGVIYGYPCYVGQVQSGLKKRLLGRHTAHLRNHPKWSKPVILERVTGKSLPDLIFNLTFQETIWMFKRHTYRPIWGKGFNKVLPFKNNYKNAGLAGAKGLVEKRKKDPILDKKIRDFFSKIGLKYGRKNGLDLAKRRKKDAVLDKKIRASAGEGGHLAQKILKKKGLGLYDPKVREKGRTISNEKQEDEGLGFFNPDIQSELGKRANHKRWHEARGIINPTCTLCQEKVT
jgi:hypothetical protein